MPCMMMKTLFVGMRQTTETNLANIPSRNGNRFFKRKGVAITKSEVIKEYEEECLEISRQCEEEGYPAHGSNYDLRCEDLWDNYYKYEYEEAE